MDGWMKVQSSSLKFGLLTEFPCSEARCLPHFYPPISWHNLYYLLTTQHFRMMFSCPSFLLLLEEQMHHLCLQKDNWQQFPVLHKVTVNGYIIHRKLTQSISMYPDGIENVLCFLFFFGHLVIITKMYFSLNAYLVLQKYSFKIKQLVQIIFKTW